MQPHAERIYQRLWPGCRIKDLREHGLKVHILDKEFGIDTLACFGSGQWISIQEKYRNHQCLSERRLQVEPPDPDFTQEYKNAAGTMYESPGEWFHLGAQLYFFGWANESETDFEKWVLIDIAKYKLLVEQAGGLHRLGILKRNRKHGKASFYAIPIRRLQSTWICTYRDFLT
jgi:hypothetical protein